MITMITMITYVLQLWLLMSYSYMLCIYNYHADCCNSDAMRSYWYYANFVRTLPFNFKCLLKISSGGYNDKMRVLLNAILVQIVNFEVKPNRFSALKVSCESWYSGACFPFIILPGTFKFVIYPCNKVFCSVRLRSFSFVNLCFFCKITTIDD